MLLLFHRDFTPRRVAIHWPSSLYRKVRQDQFWIFRMSVEQHAREQQVDIDIRIWACREPGQPAHTEDVLSSPSKRRGESICGRPIRSAVMISRR